MVVPRYKPRVSQADGFFKIRVFASGMRQSQYRTVWSLELYSIFRPHWAAPYRSKT